MSFKIMTGIMHNPNFKLSSKDYNTEKKTIFDELISVVKETQTRYGGKTELATEHDERIIRLCDTWEHALAHGLKNISSMIRNVTDLVSGNTSEPPSFWEFAYKHLTTHEKGRFSSLSHVWTDRGKARALIRAALNERALERYVLIWLSDPQLETSYEIWAIMRDPEVTHLLPSMAAGLGAVLFAITVDTYDLNAPSKPKNVRPEPVIAAPIPVKASKRVPIKRQIISFDDANINSVSSTSSSLLGTSAPKSFSNSCNSYKENFAIDKSKNQINTTNESISVEGETETPSTIHMFRFPSIESEKLEYPDSIPTPPSDSGLAEISVESIRSLPSRNSSIQGSTSSEISENDITNLKLLLAEKDEKCAWLESRVAELSLENLRLRNQQLNSSRSVNYFTVSIPRVHLQRNKTKNFYAYEIHIIPNHGGDEWTVLKRYSDFYQLHKKYQKDNVLIKTLDFPPKKKIGNMDAHFVEQRRQRLQVYLRHIITILTDVAACTTRSQLEHVFPFFKT